MWWVGSAAPSPPASVWVALFIIYYKVHRMQPAQLFLVVSSCIELAADCFPSSES